MALRAHAGVAAVAQRRERWKTAEASLRKALELDEDNIALTCPLGTSALQTGNRGRAKSDAQKKKFNAAYKLFQDIYAKAPDKTGRAEINMANLYQEVGKEENALQLIKLAIERDPDNLSTQLAAAQWALATGRS